MSDMGSARRAKDELKKKVADAPWCVGIGVEREDGVGFVVRITVAAGSLAAARDAIGGERVGGVLVKIIESDS
jgi:hypothetical protein